MLSQSPTRGERTRGLTGARRALLLLGALGRLALEEVEVVAPAVVQQETALLVGSLIALVDSPRHPLAFLPKQG